MSDRITVPRLSVPCPVCENTEMIVSEQMREDDKGNPLAVDIYQCPTEGCGRKFCGIFEPHGGLTATQQTWVEKEVARRGAFFPQDYVGNFPRGRRG